MEVGDTRLGKHDREIIDTEGVSRPLPDNTKIDNTENTIDRTFALEDGEKVPPSTIGTVSRDCLDVFCIFELDDFGVWIAEAVVFDQNCESFFVATFRDEPSRRFRAQEAKDQTQNWWNRLQSQLHSETGR